MSDDQGPWHAWQREHSEALAALQEKQRAYYRVAAAQALGGSTGDSEAAARHKELLGAVDAARVHLDQIRVRRPAAD